MAKAARSVRSIELKNALKILREHGIRAEVYRGELFIDARDWRRFNRLCDEGKLPKGIYED